MRLESKYITGDLQENFFLNTACLECWYDGYNPNDEVCITCHAKKKQQTVKTTRFADHHKMFAEIPIIVREENNFHTDKTRQGKRYSDDEIYQVARDRGYPDEVTMWKDLVSRMKLYEAIEFTGLTSHVVTTRSRKINLVFAKRRGYTEEEYHNFAIKAGYKDEADMYFDDGNKIWKHIAIKAGISRNTFDKRRKLFKEK